MNHARRDFLLITTLLLVILVLAAGLRFYNLGSQSLWSDEGNSAALATRSMLQIARDAAHDIHPPLYYLLLHFWVQIFGMTEFGLRSLSAVLGVLLVLTTAEIGRRLYGPATGLAAAFIGAVAPLQVYYSQEARMYILLALLTAAAFLQFWWFLEYEERALGGPGAAAADDAWSWLPLRLIPLAIIWILGLYTHYLFPLMIGVTSLLYLVWVLGTRWRGWVWRRLIRWTMLLVIALAFFGPWLPVALHQATTWPTATAVSSAHAAIMAALRLLSLGPTGSAPAYGPQLLAMLALAGLGAIPWRFLLTPFLQRHARRAAVAEQGTSIAEPEGESSPARVVGSRVGSGARPDVPIVLAGGILAPPMPAMAAAVGSSVPSIAGVPMQADVPERTQKTNGNVGTAGNALTPLPHGATWYWVRWLTPLAWALSPLLLMLSLGLFRDAYLKFLLIASPAFVLLLSRGVIGPAHAINLWGHARPRASGRPASFHTHDLIGGIWVALSLWVIAAISLSALSRYYTDPHLARDDYRGIAQFLHATQQPGDAVLLDAPGQAEVFDYYFDGQMPVYPLPGERPMNREATLEQLNKLYGHNKVYALYWASQEADPDGLIEKWLDRNGYKTLDQWHGNVRLAVYVMPEQRPPDENAHNLNLDLGPIRLLGYDAWNRSPHAGEVTQVQLQWRADQTPDRRYKVFLQLLDPRDQVIAQRDAEPAGESRPTTTWQAGEVIQDNHGLLIPPGTPPGTYRRIVGLYNPDTGERLRLPTGEDHIDLAPIKVERPAVQPPLDALGMHTSQNFDFGGIKLLGYDRYKRGFKHAPDTPVNPGDRLHLTLYWQANVRPRADWWFDMTLTDAAGHVVASQQAPLVGPTYSTMLWEAQEIVRGEHDLILPADLPPDTYRLSLTLLPDTNTPAGAAYLGTVKVEKPGK